MGKECKTNVMRTLDRMKISYDVIRVEIDDFKSGVQAADLEGVPHEETYKTLIAIGKSRAYYVFVIPIEDEVNLKEAAREVGEKSVELLPLKDLTRITGYVRGGCSPIGMKKQFPVVLQADAKKLDRIYVSAGRIGVSVHLSPDDLLAACGGRYGNLT